MRLVTMGGLATAAMLLSSAGCSKSTPTGAPSGNQPAPASTAAPAAGGGTAGSVSGTAAAGAIVVLEPKAPREFPQADPPVMDQVSLTFTPDMLFVRTGLPTEFHNSDDTLHNVHVDNSDTREPSFNVAIPTGEKYTYTFKKDGFYHVGCDIHPAMSAEIFSSSSPYVMRAATDGSYAFADVPPGAYVLRVLAGGTKTEKDVEVKGGGNTVAAPERQKI